MRTVLIIFFFIRVFQFTYGQDDTQWNYGVDYLTTEDCPDSVNGYTEVEIVVNELAMINSARMVMKIDCELGGSDIYDKSHLKQLVLTHSPDFRASKDDENAFVVSLGKSLIKKEPFITVSS